MGNLLAQGPGAKAPSTHGTGRDDGLDPARRRRENRNTATFLLGFLVICAALALYRFEFFIWTMELACGVIYVAIFMFALGIHDYSEDKSALLWGTTFLFTFCFDVFYGYVTTTSGGSSFRLAPPGLFLWICTQWFQASTFLVIINRKKPAMGLLSVILVCSSIGLALLAIQFLYPGLPAALAGPWRPWYLGINALAFLGAYGWMAYSFLKTWQDRPEYFALRTIVSLAASCLACLGLMFTMEAPAWLVFAFYYLRFVSLCLCYSANVTFILLSPYRALYGKLSARANELADANATLSAALTEKEVLLGEVHHRVKNNLQVVSSLLSLQAWSDEDPKLRAAFAESQGRIRTMAVVHEMLYQNKSFAAIDLAEYLERMVGEIHSASGRPEIRVSFDCQAILIPIDQAIPCGLIVNEVVTNSFKHAFPGARAGSITASLAQDKDQVELRIEDDGVGFPEGTSIEGSRTLGFTLLQSLSRQIGGRYALSGGEGTKFILSFPLHASGGL